MPEAKKITELPVLSSVQPNDILPIVDSLNTQTSKCTASQIAVLGGGPPGTNTVETSHLKDAIVTAQKAYFSGPDKLVSRTETGAGPGTEIACTSYARGLLALTGSSAALQYLGGLQTLNDPTFTGQVKLGNGTAFAPSLTNTGNTDTGLFFPANALISLTADGYESFRFGSDGSQYSNIIDVDAVANPDAALRPLYPQYVARAWVAFNGTGNTPFSITNQHIICERYLGIWGSLAATTLTQQKIQAIELATTGWSVTFPSNYTTGTEGRTNYTTPQDNNHWKALTAANDGEWQLMDAEGQAWIGRITLNPPTNGRTIKGSGNIKSVTYGGATGIYDIVFQEPLLDANYAVVASCASDVGGATSGFVRTISPSKTGFRVTCVTSAGAAYDPAWVSVVVIR